MDLASGLWMWSKLEINVRLLIHSATLGFWDINRPTWMSPHLVLGAMDVGVPSPSGSAEGPTSSDHPPALAVECAWTRGWKESTMVLAVLE